MPPIFTALQVIGFLVNLSASFLHSISLEHKQDRFYKAGSNLILLVRTQPHNQSK